MNLHSTELRVSDQYDAQLIAGIRRDSVRQADERVRLFLYVALFATDILAVFLGFTLANLLRHGYQLNMNNFAASVALLPVFAGIAINSNAYSIDSLRDTTLGMSRAILSLLFAAATLIFLTFYLKASMELSRATVGMGVAFGVIATVIGRSAFAGMVARNFPQSRKGYQDQSKYPNLPWR